MSEDMTPDNSGANGENWMEFLRSFLGEQGAEDAIRAMREAGLDPSAMGQAAGIPMDPHQLQLMVNQMHAMMASGGDTPINEDMARDVARQVARGKGDPSVMANQEAQYRQALQVADLWLDSVTDFSPCRGSRDVLSRAQWVENTRETLIDVATPVATHMVDALIETLSAQIGDAQLPEGLNIPGLSGDENFGGIATGMMTKMSSAIFGAQLGQAIGTLGSEVFGYCDIGLPLTPEPRLGLIPVNIEAFAEDLDVPFDEVVQFLAVREAAAGRLYSNVPWLASHVRAILRTYAEGIEIDMDAMTSAIQSVDPTNPEQIREAMSSGVFALHSTEEQKAALERLETALAVVEGWVDVVTEQATRAHLPNTSALQEMLRRRRATGGPAEHVFATLVGLELRPARLRDAAKLFSTVERERGAAARDELWRHPDVMPTPADLDEPETFLARREAESTSESDIDAGLAALLDGTLPYHDEASAHDDDEKRGEGN